MPGADSIFRVIVATVVVVVLGWMTAIGFKILDPLYITMVDASMISSLGWGAPQDTIMLFTSLALIGLTMVVIIWLLVAPVKNDVRQSTGPPF